MVDEIKKIVYSVIAFSRLADIDYGKVESAEPLVIRTKQDLTLQATRLVVPEHLKRHAVTIEDNGDRNVVVHGELMPGDGVILIRHAGGQKYTVLGRT